MDKKIVIALKKASSNIRKTLSMTEDGRPIIDLLQMNAATLGLLRSAQRTLIRNCIEDKLDGVSHSKKSRISKEVLEEVVKMVKSYDK
jgi:DNA-binding FrmR family transcriptional regulator